ncbi:MAG TPA: sterol desaturase family protein [Desulfuromonadales bacterium]|nr:sterol desaturase family protein [Desulfuromonadales bacterium]
MSLESGLRLTVCVVVLIAVACGEILAPRRPLSVGTGLRWLTNFSLLLIGSLFVRFALPIVPVALSQLCQVRGWGLFNLLNTPPWLATTLSFFVLDFIIYLQHAAFHHIPVLWRFHRMHHTDLDLDVSSGNRFHPIEFLLSMCIKMGAIVLLGAPGGAVLMFEIVLNACALFNHGNIKLPDLLDRRLRLFLVTPDMHRVHHSVIPRETNSNFGFNLPLWDRLFGTYRPQPEKGHLDMTIGLKEYRDPHKLTLYNLLLLPFSSPH